MAKHHAASGEIIDLAPLTSELKAARTRAIVKTDAFEAVRLVAHAGADIKAHKVDGPITLHCLEGRVQVNVPGKSLELFAANWIYLEGGVPHSIKAIEDSSLLLTIVFAAKANETAPVGKHLPATGREHQTEEELDMLLEEGLEETFPASDPVAVSNPLGHVGSTDHNAPEDKTSQGAATRDRRT
ncbi:cupin domain-containing protein [Ciceribacter thiooxidans]|uniref:Cupin domain-containing protein n=1 Tax=Ciceribacter thiooxidans TaxID=1969821 RepID=A0ABV7I6N6_9HYPH|nr:cupin domain-containing protein [Ciceribacter thiooxidans]MDI6838633.1 cupin domain-containing protein [Rhizobiaceae bacterium]